MANNYQESSSFLAVPKEKLKKVEEIINTITDEILKEDGDCNCDAEIHDFEGETGVWFHGEEFVQTNHVEQIARALIEQLEIDEPFYCSWAYTCSKPRIDEFGGGAFVIQRGFETYWCDAMSHVVERQKAGLLIPLKNKK